VLRIRTLALIGRCAFVAGLAAGCGSQPLPETGDGQVVQQALQADGHRFSGDGSAAAVFDYIKTQHQFVPVSPVRPGDVLFFSLGGDCPQHAAWVDAVEDSGRIAFRESRYGMNRLSYLYPDAPGERRAPDGRILNSFLRARRPEDPPGTRYYAGELLCAVGRVRRPPLPATATESMVEGRS
jgi:hypothetical protein